MPWGTKNRPANGGPATPCQRGSAASGFVQSTQWAEVTTKIQLCSFRKRLNVPPAKGKTYRAELPRPQRGGENHACGDR